MQYLMVNIFFACYRLAWRLGAALVRRNSRMALGWSERILEGNVGGPYDLWIQSASGGESMLTNMVIEHLAKHLSSNLHILVTSGTKQGIDSLEKGMKQLAATTPYSITVRYFPLDAPPVMERAFEIFRPQLAIVVETELWPGFLVSAKKQNIPVWVINGRMSERSFSSYQYFSWFFHHFGPDRVWAISTQDAERFARVVGDGKTEIMNNIKFDRIMPRTESPADNKMKAILLPQAPFVLLGSVRREEEEKILAAITLLFSHRKDIIVGLFPKHIERADEWLRLLESQGLSAKKRSGIIGEQKAGTVIVWDVFGELAGAYALASATFVGGSLLNLGGQNFLEPLVFGLRPVIGPYWKNFAWVGREIIQAGLVREVPDEKALAAVLLKDLETTGDRMAIIDQVQTFFTPRQGGTKLVADKIARALMTTTERIR
jgi:3-deoxy-D-manno-octulosonic-acid transferase